MLPALAHPGPPRPGPAGDVLRLVAVTAGLGQPSTARILADRLAEAARARLGERGRQVLVEVLELRDLALDIAGAMVAGFPGAKLRAALDAVEGADGLIAVSPIYTASYSGLFKSFFDVLDKDALTGKPTLIAATGGTARHSLALDHALRPMFAYLRAFMVPTAVFAASEDWASTGENSLNERISRAGTELGDLMAGTPAAGRRRRDEFEDVVPFEQRMAALRSGI
ncbi:FMN reductase [Catenulispora acidiphila]|uniref:FMN reductase n=1 Tax=Catenulispora acidiphila TaxID=304895 RepID=UPI0037C14065